MNSDTDDDITSDTDGDMNSASYMGSNTWAIAQTVTQVEYRHAQTVTGEILVLHK